MERQGDNQKEIDAYFAADLFDLPNRLFNEYVVDELESCGIKAFCPQRDGFEFAKLSDALAEQLSPQEAAIAAGIFIYALDLKKVSESDLVIARLDEPQDPGVIKEIAIANMLEIPVLIYRTDVRDPHGSGSDHYGGMHSFTVKESQVLIFQESTSSAEGDLQNLTEKIITNAKSLVVANSDKPKTETPKALEQTFAVIDLLFGGLEDVRSEEVLNCLVQRYINNKEMMQAFGPQIIR